MWSKLYVNTLQSLPVIDRLAQDAFEANSNVIQLRNSGAAASFSILNQAANQVVRDADYIKGQVKKLWELLKKDWASFKHAIDSQSQSDNKEFLSAQAAVKQKYEGLTGTIQKQEQNYTGEVTKMNEENVQQKMAVNKMKCSLNRYPDCKTVKEFDCPSGIYNVDSGRYAEGFVFCEDGKAHTTSGCGKDWVTSGGYCFRLFSKAWKKGREMKEMFMNYDEAVQTCKEHDSLFENNNRTDKAAIFEMPNWRLQNLNKVQEEGGQSEIAALWVGETGGIKQGVMTVTGRIQEAAANFQSLVICKKVPIVTEVTPVVHSCACKGSAASCHWKDSSSPLYVCPKKGNGDKLPAPQNGRESFSLGMALSKLSHVQIELQSDASPSTFLLFTFFNAERREAGTRTIQVGSATGPQQLNFTAVVASSVTVKVLEASALKRTSPLIRSITFLETTPVRAVPVEQCTASSKVKGYECEHLYDGSPTFWRPADYLTPGWVRFEFSAVVAVNRMWLRHAPPQQGGSTQLQVREGLAGRDSENSWLEEATGTSTRLTLEFANGKTFNTEISDQSAEGGHSMALTLILPDVETNYVKMTLQDPSQLVVTEVLFFKARLFSTVEGAAAHWNKQLMQVRQQMSTQVRSGAFTGLQTRVRIFGWVKDAAETAAMELCLAGLSLVNAVLSVVKGVINGIAAVLIKALEAAIKAMGPKFFQILNLGIGGSFDGLAGGKMKLAFDLDMWLFNMRLKFGFKIVFTLADIIKTLFKKATGLMGKVFRL